MIEITSRPSRGGMNQDDALENLPRDDYENGVNLTLEMGDTFLRKLKGTEEVEDPADFFVGATSFGMFKFEKYCLLFLDNGTSQSIIKITETVEVIFDGILNIDTSIPIIDCVVAHEELMIFNNGVDEPRKINIPMSKLSLIDWTQAPQATIAESNGYLAFSGTFESDTNRLYIADPFRTTTYNKVINNTLEGRVEGGLFITNIPIQTSAIGTMLYYRESGTDFDVSYNGNFWKDFLFINTPPLDPPTLDYVSEPNKKTNKIDRLHFQFQAKYVYHDGTQSAWSPISELLVDSVDSSFVDNNNGIKVKVKHPIDYERYTVKEVVFGVRKNEGDLYEYDRIPATTGNLENYNTETSLGVESVFFNDSILTPISLNEQTSLFDRIPLKCNGIDLIDESRIVFAGVEKGMDMPSPDVFIEPVYHEVPDVTATDWIMGFSYKGDTDFQYYGSGLSSDIQYSGDWIAKRAPYGYGDVTRTHSRNKKETGDSITSTANGSDVVETYSQMYRNKEASWRSTYVYLQLSSTQSTGTEYEIRLNSLYKHPTTGEWIGTVYNEVFTVVASTTSTQDLIDDIKTTIDNHSSFNKPWGDSGDTIYTEVIQATADAGSSTGWIFPSSGFEAPSEWSIEIRTGLQCVHNDSGHYHWYQIDYAQVNVKKKNTLSSVQKTLKRNAVHPWAVSYVDHSGRCTPAIPIGELDMTANNTMEGIKQSKVGVKFHFRHSPPKYAVKYRLLYAGNKTFKNFIYAVVKTSTVSGSFQEITLNLDDYNSSQGTNLAYDFTEGDVIQRLQTYDSGTSEWTVLSGEDTDPMRVISEDTGTITVYGTSNVFLVGDLVVINTPKLETEEDDILYYEVATLDITDGKHDGNVATIGDAINIPISGITGSSLAAYSDASSPYDGNLYIGLGTDDVFFEMNEGGFITINNTAVAGTHKILNLFTDEILGTTYYFVILDTTYQFVPAVDPVSLSITGTHLKSIIELTDVGDTYFKYRNVYDNFVEDYSMSDFYPSSFWGKGRPSAVSNEGKKWFGSSVYYTEPYYDNTNLNGIATVYAGNFEDYNQSKGDIQRVMEHNGRLMLFHENKVGWADINKSVITTASGETIISKSNEVLSSVEQFYTYETGIGNQIYSLGRDGNSIYFADNITKAFYRLAQNGIVPISDYKMNSYFSELFEDSSVQIYTFVDGKSHTLHLHIKSDTLNKQLTFSEVKNRWLSFYDYPCEVVKSHNGVTYSFQNNKLWKHTDTVNRNLIHGNQLTSSLTKTFSEPNEIYKAWRSLMLDPLFADNDDLPIEIENEEGQSSNLIFSDFRRVGTGSWAGFLRDINDGGLVNGQPLMSKYLTMVLESDSIADTPINRIVVKYNNLEQNNP